MFAMLIRDAFHDTDDAGIYLKYRTDGGIFNLRRLRAKTKVAQTLIRELLFADDCAIMAHTLEHIQKLMDCFANAAKRFGLTISLKKTEVMLQPRPGSSPPKPDLFVNDTPLNVVDKFCYLGSVLSQNAEIDDDITRRISAASAAFGRLESRLWKERGVRLSTKVAVYKAVVITTLLYGCESWTTYRRHVRSLDQFHMRCLRRIARIKWQDKTPSTEVLRRCEIPGIEAFVIKAQLRWVGHVHRMSDSRIPKATFYAELSSGTRPNCRPLLRFKDNFKANLLSTGIDPKTWEDLASDRSKWRKACSTGVQHFEDVRIAKAEEKRSRRKGSTSQSVPAAESSDSTRSFICGDCGRQFTARIGLIGHSRIHRK